MIAYLVGDIGGTNTRLQLFQVQTDFKLRADNNSNVDRKRWEEGSTALIASATYKSGDYASLVDILRVFLPSQYTKTDDANHSGERTPTYVCFAVAGPVENNTCKLSNLKWDRLNAGHLTKEFGFERCDLINDFVGAAFGISELSSSQVTTLHNCPAQPSAPVAVIGAGTGLGEAYLTWDGDEYTVSPSEGGQSKFAASDREESKLMFWILNELQRQQAEESKTRDLNNKEDDDEQAPPYVMVEHVVSGTGIPYIYRYLCEEYPQFVDKTIDSLIRENSKESAAIISKHGIEETDELCKRALDIFARAYGTEAGQVALKFLPFGGLYLCGGVTGKVYPCMTRNNNQFLRALQAGFGNNRKLLSQIPVYVINKDVEIGLMGAVAYVKRVISNQYPELNDDSDSGLQVNSRPSHRSETIESSSTFYGCPMSELQERRRLRFDRKRNQSRRQRTRSAPTVIDNIDDSNENSGISQGSLLDNTPGKSSNGWKRTLLLASTVTGFALGWYCFEKILKSTSVSSSSSSSSSSSLLSTTIP